MHRAIRNLKDVSHLVTDDPDHTEVAEDVHALVKAFVLFDTAKPEEGAPVIQPDMILADAVHIPELDIPQEGIIKGDAKSVSIAAASIVAKVTRDHIMYEYDKQYPDYGFASHKGYGTAAHIQAIKDHGMCVIHRRSFIHF